MNIEELLRAVASLDQAVVLRQVATAICAGAAPRAIAESLIAGLREVFLIQMGATSLVTSAGFAGREEFAAAFGRKRTVAAMEAVGDSLVSIRDCWDHRVSLEVALCRFCVTQRSAAKDPAEVA